MRAAAAHAIALRNDPALAADLVPVFDDKTEAVRVRAAAGYLRLEGIKPPPPKSRRNPDADTGIWARDNSRDRLPYWGWQLAQQ